MQDQLLTIEEAAERCRLSVNTMRHLRQTGKGPRFGKLGRLLFVRESDLEAWVNAAFEDSKAVGA